MGSEGGERGLIAIYDGSCGICEALKQWAGRHLQANAQITFVANQSPELGDVVPEVSLERSRETLIVITEEGELLEGAEAVAKILTLLTDPWSQCGHILALRPVVVLAQPVYRLVAKNRSRLSTWFGLTACPYPVQWD